MTEDFATEAVLIIGGLFVAGLAALFAGAAVLITVLRGM